MTGTALILNPSHRWAARAEAALQKLTRIRTYQTTPESPGSEQTRQALEDGCDAVVVAGGDGTVRLVAGVLAGTEVPLGILPTGTACVYARNLGLPRRLKALRRALCGRIVRADIGWAKIDAQPPTPFLVACGMGRDAEAIAQVSSRLKRRIGWLAYADAGFRVLQRRPIHLQVNGEPVAAWSVLVGNVGRLPLAHLFPGARPDDALLHAIRIWPERPGHWLGITARGLLHDPRPAARLERWESTHVEVCSPAPAPVHVDGDLMPPARRLHLSIQPGAVLIRL